MNDGYVGITNNFDRRIQFHLKYCYDNPHLKQAVSKYQDIVVDTVYEGTKQECQIKEFELRPSRLIGWNIAEGGGIPPNARGKKWTQQRREKYLKTITENQSNFRTPEQIKKTVTTRQKNGYVEGKNLKPELIIGTLWWNNGNTNKRSKTNPGEGWNLGRTKFKHYGKVKICPHCGKNGKGSGMIRFHFENCKLMGVMDETHSGKDQSVNTNKRPGGR